QGPYSDILSIAASPERESHATKWRPCVFVPTASAKVWQMQFARSRGELWGQPAPAFRSPAKKNELTKTKCGTGASGDESSIVSMAASMAVSGGASTIGASTIASAAASRL